MGAWIDGKRSWKQEKAPGWPLRVGVYVENFVNPHGDVYSGGKRSIFDLLVVKSITK